MAFFRIISQKIEFLMSCESKNGKNLGLHFFRLQINKISKDKIFTLKDEQKVLYFFRNQDETKISFSPHCGTLILFPVRPISLGRSSMFEQLIKVNQIRGPGGF